MSSEKAAAITKNTNKDKNIFGKSTTDFLILLITGVTMLALDVVLSIAYYRSSTATDLRWLLAMIDLTVVLSFYGAFGGRVKHMLLSMKLALTMLFVILILSVIGTILPQGDDVVRSGWPSNPLYGFYKGIGLFSMYGSRWFLALLYLLGANISFCILDRLPTTLRRATRPRTDVKDIFVRKCPAAFSFKGAGQNGLKAVKDVLSSHRYHLREGDAGAGMGEKGRWSGLASIAFHLSFLFIGVGAIISTTMGFDEQIVVPDGLSAPVPHSTDLKIINHKFKKEVAEVKEGDRVTGYQVSSYTSDLELTGNNESLARKTITVNDPLSYSSANLLVTLLASTNVKFHQSSYEQLSNGSYATILQVTYKPGKSLIYIGFGLMMAGICAIYFPHRRIWFKLGESGELLVGGRTNRSRVSFQRDFDRIVSELRLKLGKQED